MKVGDIGHIFLLVFVLYMVYLYGYYDGANATGKIFLVVQKNRKTKPKFTCEGNVIKGEFKKPE